MSYQAANEPTCTNCGDKVELIIEPHAKDLGEFSVRRVLPSARRRMVGPFVFFDHMGPAEFPPGEGIQVRPHPHIGLATVTYLFEGEIMHRDSLGVVQPIRAEAVNLMTAGRGIVHSERAGDDLHSTSRLHGIQTWMALPDDQQECEPDFVHYPAAELPGFEQDGVSIRLIMGEAYGYASPVTQHAPTLYLECRFPGGTSLTLPNSYDEIAAYVVSGDIHVDGYTPGQGQMAVACPGNTLHLDADSESHVMVIGGTNLGKRHVWWNFVSNSKQRIEQASDDWREDRFEKVPGETEFIPLPD
ncbi:MAG: pirin family protein [Gammaproteobacteria bacterium]|nr:pirin family protein [Gammaproteobacteria bacterium]